MDITQAIHEPNKKSLVSLEFTVANIYPTEKTDRGYKTRVMASTPQGMPTPYITFFTDQPELYLTKGKSYSIKSTQGPQGPKGVQTNHWNGKPGFTVYSQANIQEQGATPQYVPPAPTQEVALAPTQVATQIDPPYGSTTPTPAINPEPIPVVTTTNTGTLSEDQLIAKFGAIYAKSYLHIKPRLQEIGDTNPDQKAHEFGLKAISAASEWWFGEKSTK